MKLRSIGAFFHGKPSEESKRSFLLQYFEPRFEPPLDFTEILAICKIKNCKICVVNFSSSQFKLEPSSQSCKQELLLQVLELLRQPFVPSAERFFGI